MKTDGTDPTPWRKAHRRLTIGMALVAVVLFATTLLLVRRSGTAEWSAVPVSVSGAGESAAAARCQATTNRLLAAERSMAAIPGSGPWAVPADIVHPVVVAERRGAITSVLLSGAGTKSVCIGNYQGGMRPTAVQALGPGVKLSMNDEGAYSTNAPGQIRSLRSVDGQVAPTVSEVRIRTDDGRSLQASIGSAFFLAWWPSSSRAASVTAYDAHGTVLSTCRPTDQSRSPEYRCQTP